MPQQEVLQILSCKRYWFCLKLVCNPFCTNSLWGCSYVGHRYMGTIHADSAVPFHILLAFPLCSILRFIYNLQCFALKLVAKFRAPVPSSPLALPSLFMSPLLSIFRHPTSTLPHALIPNLVLPCTYPTCPPFPVKPSLFAKSFPLNFLIIIFLY